MKKVAYRFLSLGFILLSVSCSNSPGYISDNSEKKVISDGYSETSNKNYTGSASTVEDPNQAIPLTVYLKNIAGVYVSGEGRSARIRIRGLSNSFVSDSEPLFIINGTPVQGGFETVYDMVPTFDIKRVSVLKDAASTGIYGNRAANGVIVITLKKSNS